jgi:hypothetical protein
MGIQKTAKCDGPDCRDEIVFDVSLDRPDEYIIIRLIQARRHVAAGMGTHQRVGDYVFCSPKCLANWALGKS